MTNQSSTEKTKIAVIGVGALGRHHARILAGLNECELIAVAEPNEQIGQPIAEQHGCRWVADYHECLNDIDAVSIVVPTVVHHKIGVECLEMGLSVLMEKPLAKTVTEATELVDAAKNNNALLQVGHIERFNPVTPVAKKMLGTPRYIKGERLSPYAFRSTDIGVIHDLMIHDIDLVLSFVNSPVQSVDAFGISILGENEDSVQARLHFENGCIADLSANRVNPEFKRAMQIWSDTGSVDIDFNSQKVTSYSPSEQLLFGTSPLEKSRQPGADIDQLKQDIFGKYIQVDEPEVQQNVDALTAELSSFLHCIQTGSRPICNGEDGLKAMQVAEMILDSVQSHQWQGTPTGATGAFPHQRTPVKRAG